MNADELMAAYPRARVNRDVLFVDDGDIVTSAGTAAGIDACLHLVRRELGAAIATTIARRMVVPPQRDGGQRQFVDTPIPECATDSLRSVLAWMEENLDTEQPVAVLARRAAMSDRTFARRFVQETGTTPAKWLAAATGSPRPRASREQRPRHRPGGQPQRLRQRRAAATPLHASGRRRPERLSPDVQPYREAAGRGRAERVTVDLQALTPDALRARRTLKWASQPDDVLAMWVAEMDYPTAPAITAALHRAVDAETFGYPLDAGPSGLADALAATWPVGTAGPSTPTTCSSSPTSCEG